MTISELDVARAAPSLRLIDRYAAVRRQTEKLCEPLETEDYVVSTMTDVSPTKWHLAHTSWFFETFVLAPFDASYVTPNPRYAFLFNSYYVQAGERHCRAQRGLVTRPTVAEVFSYRAHVDAGMRRLLDRVANDVEHPAWPVIELGLHHEQQHQELLLTDIKHVFWMNPLRPVYRGTRDTAYATRGTGDLGWVSVPAGIYRIGHEGGGFSFDNESPAHRVFVDEFHLADRLVTNADYLAFIDDRGYHRPELWLSNGWTTVRASNWEAPIYWERTTDGWTEFTLAGQNALEPNAPVTHVSYFEADAFARWAGARLPTEPEWEIAAANAPIDGAFVESENYHPAPAPSSTHGRGLRQLYGDVWQWTQSAYTAYPGYSPAAGAIGEYNGKWMCDQWVLRGASCATPRSHARLTYRNFFPSDARWQFMGIRLAKAADA
jgi:ergothioneine biosynthesis protein EgtB